MNILRPKKPIDARLLFFSYFFSVDATLDESAPYFLDISTTILIFGLLHNQFDFLLKCSPLL